jgi:hypothetical protein
MTFCSNGDKPKVLYSFNGDKKIFLPNVSPIDVETGKESVGAYSGYNAKGFTLVMVDGSRMPVINFRLVQNNRYIQYWSCGNNDWDNRQANGTYPVAYDIPNIERIDYSRGCPPPYPPEKCYLRVLSGGKQIFKDWGDCPVEFDVVCGDKCPPGHCKCPSPNYPGYCCLPCAQVARELASITAIARSKR